MITRINAEDSVTELAHPEQLVEITAIAADMKGGI